MTTTKKKIHFLLQSPLLPYLVNQIDQIDQIDQIVNQINSVREVDLPSLLIPLVRVPAKAKAKAV
jgi:hypothetical protein